MYIWEQIKKHKKSAIFTLAVIVLIIVIGVLAVVLPNNGNDSLNNNAHRHVVHVNYLHEDIIAGI